MSYAVLNGPMGNQNINYGQLPDTTERHLPGLIVDAVDRYWGGGEFLYCKAGGSIRQFGIVSILQTVASNQVVYTATECASTAGLGRMVGVATTVATVGQFIWVQITGMVPVNSSVAVAADTTFAVAAAGQGGALAAGKQVLNARVVIASTQTVAKTNCTNNSGSVLLRVSNSDGWFAGAYLSGTGVAASATIVSISPDGTEVVMSGVSTAAISGTVTATYNNATVFYNVAHINRPFAQGAIT
jgi:hypothetical protein